MMDTFAHLFGQFAQWLNDTASHPAWLVAGIVVSVGILGYIVWGRLRRVVVPRPVTWDRVPRLGIEPGAVTDEDIRLAVDLVTSLGHRVGPVVVEDDLSLADIRIRWWDPALADLHGGERVRGLTKLESLDGHAIVADLFLHPTADGTVLAHELLHALGYLHPTAAPTGHLMHPLREHQSLSDTRGLEI